MPKGFRGTIVRSGRRIGSRRRVQSRSLTHIAAECLELRVLLAGSVQVQFTGGVLRLDGDAADNVIQVSRNSSGDLLVDGIGTQINGANAPFVVTGGAFGFHTAIVAAMNRGADTLGLVATTDQRIELDRIHVRTGDGADTVYANWIDIRNGLDVGTSDGADAVRLGHLNVGGPVVVSTGNGDDEVILVGPNFVVAAELRIHASDGRDRLEVDAVQVAGRFDVETGTGADAVRIRNSNFAGVFDIKTGNDSDLIAFEENTSSTGEHSAIQSGDELDSVRVRANTILGPLTVHAQAGGDCLSWANNQFFGRTRFDGGTGLDSGSAGGPSLASNDADDDDDDGGAWFSVNDIETITTPTEGGEGSTWICDSTAGADFFRSPIDVQFDAASGQLVVTALEPVQVQFDSASGHLHIVANGILDPRGLFITAADVRTLLVHGGDGKDLLDLSAVTLANFPQLKAVSLWGYGEADTLLGTDIDDFIVGGDSDDSISGNGGNDVVRGGDGRDMLMGGAGKDFLDGESGDDILKGQGSNDILAGGAGHDVLDGGIGTDKLTEQADVDMRLTDTSLTSGSDVDQLFAVELACLIGGAGNNRLDADGFSGQTTIDGVEGQDTVIGGSGNDVLNGSSQADTVRGGGGNDILLGGSANDLLDGGPGDDMLNGQRDNDTLTGGPGKDVLNGGLDTDKLVEQADADMTLTDTHFAIGGIVDQLIDVEEACLTGGTGNNRLDARGFTGNTTIDGAEGDDTLIGGAGNDQLNGSSQDDTVIGGGGDDRLFGGAGNDIVIGGAGVDRVSGQADDDTLLGGDGDGVDAGDVVLGLLNEIDEFFQLNLNSL